MTRTISRDAIVGAWKLLSAVLGAADRYPNWQGQSQLRVLQLDGDTVTIVASPRVAADGRAFHSELRWRRVAR